MHQLCFFIHPEVVKLQERSAIYVFLPTQTWKPTHDRSAFSHQECSSCLRSCWPIHRLQMAKQCSVGQECASRWIPQTLFTFHFTTLQLFTFHFTTLPLSMNMLYRFALPLQTHMLEHKHATEYNLNTATADPWSTCRYVWSGYFRHQNTGTAMSHAWFVQNSSLKLSCHVKRRHDTRRTYIQIHTFC